MCGTRLSLTDVLTYTCPAKPGTASLPSGRPCRFRDAGCRAISADAV